MDDGAAATNSESLYAYFIVFLNQHFQVNDLGPIRLFLGITINYDRQSGMLHMSQGSFVEELLATHNLLSAQHQDVPLHACSFQSDAPPVPTTALPEYTTAEVITKAYQRIVGSLLYLASWTHPDISYAVVALAQWNSAPSQANLLVAKGVLRYLVGT